MKQEKKTIHSYLQELGSEELEVFYLEVMEVITQEEMAVKKTLTGEILNTLAIKDHLMDEIQMMMMMETMEMIVTKTMMLQM